MRTRVFILSLFSAAIAVGVRAEPQPSATPVAWELTLAPAALNRIVVDLGKGPTVFWYMIYTVTNQTGQDVDFHPEIVRVSEVDSETPEDKAMAGTSDAPRIMEEPAIVGVDSRLFKAISERHSKTYPFLVTPVKAIDRLLQGKDNARTSVAVFGDMDARVSKFTIYFGGLSGERMTRENPRYDSRRPSEGAENPKLFVLQKTLTMPYTLPGDVRTRSAAVPVLGKLTWVMR